MKRKFDVIIIGGGPGGLAIGSLLAREGISSAIIEKDPVLGGRYRSVDFHGCRVDCGVHFPTSLSGSPQNTSIYKLFSHLGLPIEYKIVPWVIALVSKERRGEVEFFSMDPKLGAENFFEFFAFATGLSMNDTAKQELMRVAKITADMSEQECRRVVSVCFADWIDHNVKDPIAKAVLYGMESIVGSPATEMNFGMVANAFGTFERVGAPIIMYPKLATLENAVIAPLTRFYTDHGGEVITNRTARSITMENGRATGVVVQDEQNRFMLEEYDAPVVICAIPIFEAVAKNILRHEFLTEDWVEAIRRCGDLAVHDLSGFYLLREGVMPRESHGWVHVFDVDYGIPTYVGDWSLGTFTNAIEPPGKQLVCSLILGSFKDTHFGLTSPIEKVREGNRRWKEAMEKAFPGFAEAIEFESMNLQLNFTRYAYAVVPTEIDIQSPNIQGLYFAGDSIWSVGNPMSDKVFQLAFPLCERILEYIRSESFSAETGEK